MRRALTWLGVFAVVLLVAGTLLWNLSLPEYRPSLKAGERWGIDVSNHQGEIDWNLVEEDHIDFAYIKATEGGDFTDARFAENWDFASGSGIGVGAYHFFTLCTPGAEQARHFLTVTAGLEMDLPPALDLELPGNCSARPPADEVAREVDAFLDAVERQLETEVVIYLLPTFADRYPLDLGDRPRWIRRILLRPSEDEWSFWQVTDRARIDGVPGLVDLNVSRDHER